MTQWGLDALFNPAKRHMDEEKRRLQSTREEIGDSSGGKRIDFESGRITIRRSKDGDEADEAAGKAETTKPSATKPSADRPARSAAAERAAARRARSAKK